MENEQQNPDYGVDGGAPTDEEARLAAQVDTIGDDPQSEPEDTAAAPAPAPGAADDDAAAAAVAEVVDTPAAAAPAPVPTPTEPAAVDEPAPTQVAAPARPEPPKDFQAELDSLQKQYDDGDLDGADFQAKQRDLMREEARFEARLALHDERVQDAARDAETAWNTAAVGWEKANTEFMANPLRAAAMQQALALTDKNQPGLPPAKLFETAQKIAFEAYNWQAKADPAPDAGAPDGQAVIDAALRAREGKPVPQTLGTAPAAAQIETRGNAAFSELDGRDISDLEDALARMTPAQQEAYLRDAPGANTNDPTPRERKDR